MIAHEEMKMNLGSNATFILAIKVFRCFNVAAICALGIWHGYAFYAHQSEQRQVKTSVIEFHLINRDASLENRDKP